uniref:Uncharacterized protein n=1 Tax=Strigamia maritima TaxID=126957 RepID=T1INM9_STRMM
MAAPMPREQLLYKMQINGCYLFVHYVLHSVGNCHISTGVRAFVNLVFYRQFLYRDVPGLSGRIRSSICGIVCTGFSCKRRGYRHRRLRNIPAAYERPNAAKSIQIPKTQKSDFLANSTHYRPLCVLGLPTMVIQVQNLVKSFGIS